MIFSPESLVSGILIFTMASGILALLPGRTGPFLMVSFSTCAAVMAIFLLFALPDQLPWQLTFDWFRVGDKTFTVGALLHRPAAFMTLVVTFITLVVSIYSLVYMEGDKGINRYFAVLGLFALSMLGIVLADNLLVLFICWELVGFASYLLINHWFEKDAAATAAFKAFLVNRIGDAGFVIGLVILWSGFGTLDIGLLSSMELTPSGWLTAAGLCLFLGVIGKSAQFPLQLWLPDAMEGPTPASALIHAATMVAAGIYLLSRTLFLFDPTALNVIAVVGSVTAFMGAVAAINQYDIKKVLAYSTISQLGYMVMAMGTNQPNEGMMHLYSHAFFKAGLFLAAGSIIHVLHKRVAQSGIHYDVQDMRQMGGLRSSMPSTFISYLLLSGALIGLPLTSGFLTKDAILYGAIHWLQGEYSIMTLVPVLAFVTVGLTAYYMVRQLVLVFWGETRAPKDIAHPLSDPPWLMRIPVALLAISSLWVVWSLNPLEIYNGALPAWLFGGSTVGVDSKLHLWVSLASLCIIGIGGSLAWRRFALRRKVAASSSFLNDLSKNNWWMDRIYARTVVAPISQLAVIIQRIDVKIIDRIINTLGIFYVLFCHIVAWFDKQIVDGTVHAVTGTARFTGNLTSTLTKGGVQFYVWAAVLTAFLMIWFLI